MKNRKTTKQRVLEILKLGMKFKRESHFLYNGVKIPNYGGWIPQWVFAETKIVGSTCGKRRFRDLKTELLPDFTTEVKNEGRRYFYRLVDLRPRERTLVNVGNEYDRGSAAYYQRKMFEPFCDNREPR
ncbi:MAG TPA: hypothetical protein ENI52_01250 [Thermoplasmata archaeon]|nr:hypothetical protein [Thermoplasmata archaeon]